MKRYLTIGAIIIVALLLAITANAQPLGHLIGPGIYHDARAYEEFIQGRGGPEGYSGAYVQIGLGVTGYNLITNIKAKAEHEATKFEVTLREDTTCLFHSPPEWGIDTSFGVFLRRENWMTGDWKLILEYKKNGKWKKETAWVKVPRFNSPPIPTGIEIAMSGGKRYLVWNRIGDPGPYSPTGKHVEYRIRHFMPSLPCMDEDLVIAPGRYPYELWSGNRIAVPLPTDWISGDRIRIENRVYDDNPESGGIYRFDRACKDVILR